jgi:hypothetical protein
MDKMDYRKAGARYLGSERLSDVVKGLTAVASIGSFLRYLGPSGHRTLGWLGLRRRSTMGTVALFGAGLAAGAIASVFLTPLAGQETRRSIGRWFRAFGRDEYEGGREGGEAGESGDHNGSSRGHRAGHRSETRGEGMTGGTRSAGGSTAEGVPDAGSKGNRDTGNREANRPLGSP